MTDPGTAAYYRERRDAHLAIVKQYDEMQARTVVGDRDVSAETRAQHATWADEMEQLAQRAERDAPGSSG